MDFSHRLFDLPVYFSFESFSEMFFFIQRRVKFLQDSFTKESGMFLEMHSNFVQNPCSMTMIYGGYDVPIVEVLVELYQLPVLNQVGDRFGFTLSHYSGDRFSVISFTNDFLDVSHPKYTKYQTSSLFSSSPSSVRLLAKPLHFQPITFDEVKEDETKKATLEIVNNIKNSFLQRKHSAHYEEIYSLYLLIENTSCIQCTDWFEFDLFVNLFVNSDSYMSCYYSLRLVKCGLSICSPEQVLTLIGAMRDKVAETDQVRGFGMVKNEVQNILSMLNE
jgi:hypothetical protein